MRIMPALVAFFGVSLLQAQTSLFITAQQGDQATSVANGSVLNVAAPAVGTETLLKLTIYYPGSGTLTISPPQLLGSSAITMAGASSFPATLSSNRSASFSLSYLPTGPDSVQTQLAVAVAELKADGTTASGLLAFLIVGTAPAFTVSYSMAADNNAFPLASGGTLTFPSTAVSSSSTATVVITNKGTSKGLVNSLSVSGDSFQLLNLPLVPAPVDANSSLRFNVRFTPQANGPASGQLNLGLASGSFPVILQGVGSGPAFAYELVLPDSTQSFGAGDPLRLPDTLVGSPISVAVRVSNRGTADGQIGAIGATGAAFAVTSLPALPLTMHPKDTFVLTLTFNPQQGGSATGSLRIGNDNFSLTGTGLATQFTYSYGGAGVQPNGTVFLPTAAVGRSSQVTVTVTNAGSAAASIHGIMLNRTSPDLSLSDLPPLPKNLDPGASCSFTLLFAPRNTGATTNTLAIDDKTFAVSGAGSPPPKLPDYQFQGAGGAQDPLQQPAVGLSLSEPYPLPLNGTLTLTATSEEFAADPSVQFSTGGQAVSFLIPANSIEARFANGATTVRLQTGTVAESITLTPSFSLAGGYSLTPDAPPSLALSVPRGAPRILQMQIVGQSANSVTLAITGLATSRSVGRLTFQLQPAAGAALASSQIVLDVQSAFDLWFQNAQSQSFGSLFSFSIPLTLNVNSPTGSLAQYLKSVSATLGNAEGTSNAATVGLQ